MDQGGIGGVQLLCPVFARALPPDVGTVIEVCLASIFLLLLFLPQDARTVIEIFRCLVLDLVDEGEPGSEESMCVAVATWKESEFFFVFSD